MSDLASVGGDAVGYYGAASGDGGLAQAPATPLSYGAASATSETFMSNVRHVRAAANRGKSPGQTLSVYERSSRCEDWQRVMVPCALR